jgi:hypothetical protein
MRNAQLSGTETKMRVKSQSHRKDRCYRQRPTTWDTERRKRASFVSRLCESLIQRWQDEAQRYMARQLVQSGGRLTDDMERRLSEHLLGNGNFRT